MGALRGRDNSTPQGCVSLSPKKDSKDFKDFEFDFYFYFYFLIFNF
jgi:hypothetical protein